MRVGFCLGPVLRLGTGRSLLRLPRGKKSLSVGPLDERWMECGDTARRPRTYKG